jgi:DNA-binding NarL/FixJ family response regulator
MQTRTDMTIVMLGILRRLPSSTIQLGICDDHPVFRAGLRTLIAEAGDLAVAFECGSVRELRERISDVPVDLLLLDVALPDGSGVDEVAECVRWTRVLLLSATADVHAVRRALAAGATGFVRKDVSADELLRSIRRAAAGQRVLASELAMSLAAAGRGDADVATFRSRLLALTPRQREVLTLLAEGRTNRAIAEAMRLSEGTVKNHVTQILDALGVEDRTRLAVLIARYGLSP